MNHITVMKQALDALEKGAYQSAVAILRAAIAQPESEPVATVRAKSDAYGGIFVRWTTLPVDGMKLYAAPQVADYVPLSDEQIDDITKKTWPRVFGMVMPAYLSAYRGYARAIERAARGAS